MLGCFDKCSVNACCDVCVFSGSIVLLMTIVLYCSLSNACIVFLRIEILWCFVGYYVRFYCVVDYSLWRGLYFGRMCFDECLWCAQLALLQPTPLLCFDECMWHAQLMLLHQVFIL